MVKNQTYSKFQELGIPFLDEEIELRDIINTIYRNKKLVFKFILAGLALSSLFIISAKRVWKGEFQIVLDKGSSDSSLNINPDIRNLAGLDNNTDVLQTEVGILKSPSILMEVFEFVKKEKALKELRFKGWIENKFSFELEEGTSILYIAYRDNDKKLILPVLEQVSKAYQDYSDSERLRNLELAEQFFKDQISLFKVKSLESLRSAQKFANEKDLSILSDQLSSDLEIPNVLNIEAIRLKAANEIRTIEQQVDQIENSGDQNDQIMYIYSTIAPLSQLTTKLKNINSSLAKFRLTYQENDEKIQDLLKEEEFLIGLHKKRSLGFLNAKKIDALARMKAAERPEGVLLDYKMLLSNAAKDKLTLDNLENQYRNLLLEKARTKDPWKLITKPTLFPNPVHPKKLRTLILGLFLGLSVGSGSALALEKKKNIIFNVQEMERIAQCPLLEEFSIGEKTSWSESFELLVSGPISDTDGGIAVITIGEIKNSLLLEFTEFFKKKLNKRDLLVTKELKDIIQYPNLLVLTGIGMTKKDNFIQIMKKLSLQKQTLLGLIILKK